MEAKGRALVDNLERTLAEEAMWVEKQYRDLLEHYTQEQDNNNQAHTLTCSHLVHTLTLLLHSNKNVVSSQLMHLSLLQASSFLIIMLFYQTDFLKMGDMIRIRCLL
ncbi:hypothetical protein E2C01_095538 [Portunus trituberculatus]|uniref:Uncharacterized protein n=1 Tax=Portunus trituberculatus TaxID=210409 RepID=A0A5B7K4B0_PORTR|nr:hypothetical protein [Portunus trituberculatus]